MMGKLDYRVAVYTGTFDPVTSATWTSSTGAARSSTAWSSAVGINPEKTPFFSPEERVELMRNGDPATMANVSVQGFDRLAVRVRPRGWRRHHAARAANDQRHGERVHHVADERQPRLGDPDGVLMAKDPYSHLSSTLLRQIAAFGGAPGEVPAAGSRAGPGSARPANGKHAPEI